MIIENGHIEFISVTGGGLDPITGHPLATVKAYGRKIPCQYQAAAFNALAMSNGEPMTRQKYVILIESNWLTIPTERLRLTSRSGAVVGEFSIIQTEPLDAVCQYRIIV